MRSYPCLDMVNLRVSLPSPNRHCEEWRELHCLTTHMVGVTLRAPLRGECGSIRIEEEKHHEMFLPDIGTIFRLSTLGLHGRMRRPSAGRRQRRAWNGHLGRGGGNGAGTVGSVNTNHANYGVIGGGASNSISAGSTSA